MPMLGQNGGGIQQMGMGGMGLGAMGGGGMGGMNPSMMFGGLGGMLGGLFGGSGDPYSAAMDQYKQYEQKAAGIQNPFIQAGTGAIPQYQQWLDKMRDPQAFINNTMSQYQQSPWAHFQTDQAMRANNNMGSAAGLIGSTPWQQQGQQYARDISSQDMNQWLGNVMGVNSQYGQGVGNMMGMGQHAADQMTDFYKNMGGMMGQGAYGQQQGQQQDMWNTIGGIAQIAGMFL